MFIANILIHYMHTIKVFKEIESIFNFSKKNLATLQPSIITYKFIRLKIFPKTYREKFKGYAAF